MTDEPRKDTGSSPINPDAPDHEATDAGMTGEAGDRLRQPKPDPNEPDPNEPDPNVPDPNVPDPNAPV